MRITGSKWGSILALVLPACCSLAAGEGRFEGRLSAKLTRGGNTQTWLYTVGRNALRIEPGETSLPVARNIIALDSGAVTLVFPHNRSFVRLNPATDALSTAPGLPAQPGSASGIGPQPLPASESPVPASPHESTAVGPGNLPGAPTIPRMSMPPGVPMPPLMPMEKLELKATGEKTNLLGFACQKFELRQRGQVMEIWATDKLLPFQRYLANQPHRFGIGLLEEQWSELIKTKGLFPLLAVLRFEPPAASDGAVTATATPGPERLRFEVKSITPERVTDNALFQPPPDYREIQPLPF